MGFNFPANRFLTTFDRYVIGNVMTPLLTGAAIGLLILMSARLVRMLDQVLGKKGSFSLIFEMMGFLIPHYLNAAIPVALFLGLLFGLNKLSRGNEIVAIMSVGVGLNRLARPVVILATLMALFSIFLSGWAAPYTGYAFRAVVHDIRNVAGFYLVQEGVFMKLGSRTVLIDKLIRSDNSFKHLFLYDDKGAANSETITAMSGELIEPTGSTQPLLMLQNGLWLKVGKGQGSFNSTLSSEFEFRTGRFSTVTTPLGSADEQSYRKRGIDEPELTFVELYFSLDHPPPKASKSDVSAEFHKRLVKIAMVLILPFFALPFSIGAGRGQRNYRFAVATIILTVFVEFIEQGAISTRLNGTNPLLSLWLPFVIFALFAFWRYWLACYTTQSDQMAPLFEWLFATGRRVAETVRIFAPKKDQ